ncbi:MAG: hypothetical protein ACOVNQ_02020, partial [Pirellula sp.]
RRVSVPSATAGFACIANVPPTGAWHLASQLGDASIQNPPRQSPSVCPQCNCGICMHCECAPDGCLAPREPAW